jgi:transcriptional regulator with XRE-family HTH domain
MNAIRQLRERRGLTQSRLAELAHTSQPTIAAYEAGTKSPNLRTLERLARSVGLEAVVEYVPPLTREDRRSLALHRAIARRLEEEPEPTLSHARRNLRKMARQHAGARPLLSRWRALLDRPLEEILEVLVDPRPSARELRHVTPFAGVLSARERAQVYQLFARTEARRNLAPAPRRAR